MLSLVVFFVRCPSPLTSNGLKSTADGCLGITMSSKGACRGSISSGLPVAGSTDFQVPGRRPRSPNAPIAHDTVSCRMALRGKVTRLEG